MTLEERIVAYLSGDMSLVEKSETEKIIADDVQAQMLIKEYTELFDTLENEASDHPSTDVKVKFQKLLNEEINAVEQVKTMRRNWIFWGTLIAVTFLSLSIWLINKTDHTASENTIQYYASQNTTESFYRNVNQKRTSEKIAAINTLEAEGELDSEVIDALKKVLYEDESINVKLTVIESLSRYIYQEDVKKLIINALKDIDKFQKLLENNNLEEVVKNEVHAGLIKLI